MRRYTLLLLLLTASPVRAQSPLPRWFGGVAVGYAATEIEEMSKELRPAGLVLLPEARLGRRFAKALLASVGLRIYKEEGDPCLHCPYVPIPHGSQTIQ